MLDKILNELTDKIINNEENSVNEFLKFYQSFKHFEKKLLELTELAIEKSKNKKEREELIKIFEDYKKIKVSDYIEKLNKTGFRIDEKLKDSFQNHIYRIMELTRQGKREQVLHSIMRLYITANITIPKEIIESCKPIYPDDLFKTMIFSFLCGVANKINS